MAATATKDAPLKLSPMPSNPRLIDFVHISNKDRFVYCEEIKCSDIGALTQSELAGWCESAVWRGVGKDSANRLGYRTWKDTESGRTMEAYDGLPRPFSPNMVVRVTIEVYTPGE